jgi:hypothetical protein
LIAWTISPGTRPIAITPVTFIISQCRPLIGKRSKNIINMFYYLYIFILVGRRLRNNFS